jgi:gliding motility-associated-like protein
MKTFLRASILMLYFYLPAQHLQWGFGISGPGTQYSKALKLNNGTLVCTGVFENTIDADPGAGTYNLVSNGGKDVFVIRYDTDGAFLSAFSLGGTGEEAGTPNICFDPYGNLYLTFGFQNTIDVDPGTGVASHSAIAANNSVIVKYDSNGNYLTSFQLESITAETGNGIHADSNYVYVCGEFNGAVDFNPGAGTSILTAATSGIFSAKYTSAGLFKWAFSIDDAGNATNLRVDENGNVILAGFFNGTNTDFDPGAGTHPMSLSSGGLYNIFLAKYDSSANFLWAHSIPGEVDNAVYAMELSGDDIILGGYIQGTSIDLDPGAGVQSYTSVSGDAYLARFAPNGDLEWAKGFGGDDYDDIIGLAINPAGDIVVTGGFAGDSIDVDPGSDVVKFYSPVEDNTFDAYIALFDQNGNHEWSMVYGDSSWDQGSAVVVDEYDNWYFSARYGKAQLDIDPSAETFLITTNDVYDNLVFKLSPCERMNPELAANLQFKEDATVSIPVQVTIGTPQAYQWYKESVLITGATASSLSVSPVEFLDEGIYKVKVTDACMNNKWSADLSLTVIPVIKVYELISPNGDGQNEEFNIRNIDKFPKHDITVFNRWGQKVFTSQQYTNDWDGGGLPDGTYFYKVVVDKEEYNGSLLIKR